MTAKMIPNNDETAILARADEIRTERARVAAEEAAATFKPLLDLLAGGAWQEVRAKVQEIAPTLLPYPNVYMALNSLAGLMGSVGTQIPAEARAPLAA